MKWSEEVWRLAAPVYEKILELPFVRELAEGTLSPDRFMFYLQQDAMYVDNYCRVLAHIASRLTDKRRREDFLRFALDGVMVEKALHEHYLGPDGLSGVVMSPACMLYTSFETAQGLAPIEAEAAAVLPCFWVYQRVGERILATARRDNPFRQWIETYGDEAFARSTRRAVEICDELASATSPDVRTLMTDNFIHATRMEWLFWHSAYNKEQWLI